MRDRISPLQSHRSDRGFSLLEVMASMVVMTVGMLGLVTMLNMAAHQDGNGRRVDRATIIAYDLLHHLEKLPFDAPQLDNLVPTNDTDLLGAAGLLDGIDPEGIDTSAFDQTDTMLDDPLPQAATTGPSNGADLQFAGFVPVDPSNIGAGGRPTLDFNGDGKDDYRRAWMIRDLAPLAGESASPGKQITVVVSWRDPLLALRRRVAVVGFRANHRLLLPR